MYRTALLVLAVLVSAPAMAGGNGHDKGHGNGHAKHGCEESFEEADDDQIEGDDDVAVDDEIASDDLPASVLSSSVRIQIETAQRLISLMDKSDVQLRDKAGFEDAKDLVREARAANREGHGRKAGRLASDAWTELAPAFRQWATSAEELEVRAVNKTLIEAAGQRIALMRRGDVDLSATADAHVVNAERAHADALALRGSAEAHDAASRERVAIRQLDLALAAMVDDRAVASAD